MHDMELQSIRHRAKAIYEKEIRSKNKINQQFQTSRPNEVWVSDVTYFRTPYNSYYICVILDLYSRKVISYLEFSQITLSILFIHDKFMIPKLTLIARLIFPIVFLFTRQTYSVSRVLSIVRICSSKTMLSWGKPSANIFTCVGILAFECRLVIAATIVVGLCLFPISFCNMSTGRNPPCSLPFTGFKSA